MPQPTHIAAAIFGPDDNAYWMYLALQRREIDTLVFTETVSKNFGDIGTIECPSYDDPESLLSFLDSYAAAHPGTRFVVLASSDEYALFFATHRDRLPGSFVLKCPSETATQICIDKKRFKAFCEANDIRRPTTFTFESRDSFERSDSNIPYPVIVKPTFSRELPKSIIPKVIMARDRQQLLQIGEAVWAHGCSLFFQEFIAGGYEQIVFVGGYVDRQAGICELFVGTKEMEYPILGGSTTSCRLKWQDDAAESSKRLLDLLEYEGLFDIEFKRDPRDNSLVIIEINARTGLWHRVSESGSMDIISYYVLTASGAMTPDQIQYSAHTEGRVWISTYKHLLACIENFGLLAGVRRWKQELGRKERVRGDGNMNWKRVLKHLRNLLGRFRQLGLVTVLQGTRK